MTLTSKQEHVLANLERVVDWPYKQQTGSARRRFSLDGWDCSQQITALLVKRQVLQPQSGRLVRASSPVSAPKRLESLAPSVAAH